MGLYLDYTLVLLNAVPYYYFDICVHTLRYTYSQIGKHLSTYRIPAKSGTSKKYKIIQEKKENCAYFKINY